MGFQTIAIKSDINFSKVGPLLGNRLPMVSQYLPRLRTVIFIKNIALGLFWELFDLYRSELVNAYNRIPCRSGNITEEAF